MAKTFVCTLCKGEFDTEWSDEEAKAQAKATFPDCPEEEMKPVCEDCYQLFLKAYFGGMQ